MGFEHDSKLNYCTQKVPLWVQCARACERAPCARVLFTGPALGDETVRLRWSTAPPRSVLELQPCFICPEGEGTGCDGDFYVTMETTRAEMLCSAILR